MANEYSSIDCAEVKDSADEKYDDDRGVMSASVTLMCAWANRHLLVADVCGSRRPWPGGAAAIVPVAQTASIKPHPSQGTVASGSQQINYDQALVTINYSTKLADLISESIEPTSEFITLDHRLFRWGSGNGTPLREEEAPGLLVRGMNLVRNEMDVDEGDIIADLFDLVGSVNIAPYVSSLLNRTFAEGTLLYAPPTINRKVDSLNTAKYDVTKKFTIKSNDWNAYFRPLTGTYDNIYLAGEGSPFNSYPPADLSSLLP